MTSLYIHEEKLHNLKAPGQVVPVLMEMLKPHSVLDVGCGLGTWLHVFEQHGVTDYLGLDGDYVDRNLLKVPKEKFSATDLRKNWSLNRKFDLVLCLEVAEHLPSAQADDFVKCLVEHADIIVFSAAIPGQGGQHHLNEQWPEYWAAKFAHYGFYFHDLIRPAIWNNEQVDWFYRQNMFVVSKQRPVHNAMLSVVHPSLFTLTTQEFINFKLGLYEGRHGMLAALSIFWNSLKFKIKSLL